jgi:hypothetical protein
MADYLHRAIPGFCSTIETLVTFGWLPVDQHDELDSIVKAFRRFAGRALAVARNCGLDQWYIP